MEQQHNVLLLRHVIIILSDLNSLGPEDVYGCSHPNPGNDFTIAICGVVDVCIGGAGAKDEHHGFPEFREVQGAVEPGGYWH